VTDRYQKFGAQARRRLRQALHWPKLAPYERGGILYSEILFLSLCLEGTSFNRIIESGTSRGQSTLLLSTIFPDKEIISVEINIDDNHAFAIERCRGKANVTFLAGDSRILLPDLVRPDDVVVIDGPKGWSALYLALKLLAQNRPSHVFIHDVKLNDRRKALRRFIQRNLPESSFSDALSYAQTVSILDQTALPFLRPEQKIGGCCGEYGYGFALAHLPRMAERRYRTLLWSAKGAASCDWRGAKRSITRWYYAK
jgi:hypothetical protein